MMIRFAHDFVRFKSLFYQYQLGFFVGLRLYRCLYWFLLFNDGFPIWIDSATKSRIINKQLAHTRYKVSGSAEDCALFCSLRKFCKVAVEKCYTAHVTNADNDILNNNPKGF